MIELLYLNPPDYVELSGPRRPRYYPKRKYADRVNEIPKKYRTDAYGWKGGYWADLETGDRVLSNPRKAGVIPRITVTFNHFLTNRGRRKKERLWQGLQEYFANPESMKGRLEGFPVRVDFYHYCDVEKFQHDVDNRYSLYRKALCDKLKMPLTVYPDDRPAYARGGEQLLLHDPKSNYLVVKVRELPDAYGYEKIKPENTKIAPL